MPINVKRNTSGFTLIEVVISMLVLSFIAAGLVSFLITTQYTAEDNLYKSTALSVALSTLEQMKSMDTEDLDNSVSTAAVDLTNSNGTQALTLGAANTLQIPIVSNNQNPRTMQLVLTPSIQSIANDTAFWLRVEYEYEHPRDANRVRTKVIGCTRGRVQVR